VVLEVLEFISCGVTICWEDLRLVRAVSCVAGDF